MQQNFLLDKNVLKRTANFRLDFYVNFMHLCICIIMFNTIIIIIIIYFNDIRNSKVIGCSNIFDMQQLWWSWPVVVNMSCNGFSHTRC